MSRRADRCPPVRLETLYALPNGSAKLFCIAAAEGRSMNPRGTFDALGRGERPIGVRVAPTHRDRILEGLGGLSGGRWRQAVRTWEDAGLLHRCEPETIFLFLEPMELCAACNRTSRATESDAAPSSPTSLRVTPHVTESDAPVTESDADRHEPGNPLREHKRAIREAARREDFDEVVRLAEQMGWQLVAHHARLALSDPDAALVVRRKLEVVA